MKGLNTLKTKLIIMGTKYEFNKITLMWRPGRGFQRISIGILYPPKKGEKIRFEYNPEGIMQAKEVDPNFSGYPGLPIEQSNFPAEQIEELFFRRLMNNSRNDIGEFYDFWIVDRNRIDDPLYLLAQTQGLKLEDMFEFIPQYFSSHRNSFITDIAGLSKIKFDLSTLHIGDVLSFEKEKDNPKDSKAVSVSFKGKKLGYIKRGHNMVFDRKNVQGIKLYVWSLNNLPGFEKLYAKVDIKY